MPGGSDWGGFNSDFCAKLEVAIGNEVLVGGKDLSNMNYNRKYLYGQELTSVFLSEFINIL